MRGPKLGEDLQEINGLLLMLGVGFGNQIFNIRKRNVLALDVVHKLAEFGGKPGLVALMNDFMDNLMADTRTRPYFVDADREHIKIELVDQFCVILDGPCTYTGKDMEKVHRGLGINRAAFNALVEDLQTAMNKHDIPFRAQNKLLAKLAPMHKVVITK